jgi:hypothetical protein
MALVLTSLGRHLKSKPAQFERSFMRAVILALALSHVAIPAAVAQDAVMVAMRDRFETEVLAVEDEYGADIDGLRRAAMQIALRVYGSNWDAVRAEAQRSLAALPEIDLAPYERLDQAVSLPFGGKGDVLDEIMPFMGKGGMAMLRFWDAQAVAFSTAAMGVQPDLAREGAARIAVKMTLAPMRAYRGRFYGAEVLAARYYRSLVVTPYTWTADGLILPDFAHIRVYPLQH